MVTDLTTCHNTWFDPGVDKCFVPTAQCAARARRMGLADDQIVTHGLPIRPAFSKPQPSKAALRKRLGLATDTPAVLLVGGGEGMGHLEATVDALAASLGAGCQVVPVCGRNAKLQARLASK